MDFDGKFAYSRIILVKSKDPDMIAYPNPAVDYFFIKNLREKGEILIRSMEGKIIGKQIGEPGKPLTAVGLAPGTYTVTANGGIQKLVIQR